MLTISAIAAIRLARLAKYVVAIARSSRSRRAAVSTTPTAPPVKPGTGDPAPAVTKTSSIRHSTATGGGLNAAGAQPSREEEINAPQLKMPRRRPHRARRCRAVSDRASLYAASDRCRAGHPDRTPRGDLPGERLVRSLLRDLPGGAEPGRRARFRGG